MTWISEWLPVIVLSLCLLLWAVVWVLDAYRVWHAGDKRFTALKRKAINDLSRLLRWFRRFARNHPVASFLILISFATILPLLFLSGTRLTNLYEHARGWAKANPTLAGATLGFTGVMCTLLWNASQARRADFIRRSQQRDALLHAFVAELTEVRSMLSNVAALLAQANRQPSEAVRLDVSIFIRQRCPTLVYEKNLDKLGDIGLAFSQEIVSAYSAISRYQTVADFVVSQDGSLPYSNYELQAFLGSYAKATYEVVRLAIHGILVETEFGEVTIGLKRNSDWFAKKSLDDFLHGR